MSDDDRTFEHDGEDAGDASSGAVAAQVPFVDVANLAVRLLGLALHGRRDASDEPLVVADAELAPAVAAAFTVATSVAGDWPGHRRFAVPDGIAAGVPGSLAALMQLHGSRAMPAFVASLAVAAGELVLAGEVLPLAEQPWFAEHLGSPTRLVASSRELPTDVVRPEAVDRLGDVGSRLEEHHPGSVELAFLDLAAASGFAARLVVPSLAEERRLGEVAARALAHASVGDPAMAPAIEPLTRIRSIIA